MEKDDAFLNQCIEYFKSTAGFERIFTHILEKYRSFGTLGGVIKLSNLTRDEKECLSGFLRKDFYSKKNAAIKVEDIVKAIEATRFQGVDFSEVVKGYFGKDLITKKDEILNRKEEKEHFIHGIANEFQGTRASRWIQHMLYSKDNGYLFINKKYMENKKELHKSLVYVCKALNLMSLDKNNTTRLALFSSQVTKNPHSFDQGTEAGKLLLYGIAYLLKESMPNNMEKKSELLYSAGIINDEVSNFTICSGLKAFYKGVEHEGWHSFYKSEEPMLVSLYNLSCIDRVVAKSRKVFVFENPTVFTEVLRKIGSSKPSLICTYGQLRLSSLVLLDFVAQEAVTMFYSGDFDPEGLQIAEKLKKRYGDRLTLWRYSPEDYGKAKSSEGIEAARLKKLEGITVEALKPIAQLLLKDKKTGYQELIVEEYIRDIANNFDI